MPPVSRRKNGRTIISTKAIKENGIIENTILQATHGSNELI